uniref:Dynein tail n=1 Tax=Sus scrofa TaxID=9823 RepID=A0A0J9X2A1_PIG|nr:Chain 3, DYNEIN TAIL [Sus scrofa]5AFU_4 Chain 4, DYNEIN TAIL [Sus scrofa]
HYLVPYNQRANHSKPIPPFLLDLDSQSVPDALKKQTNDYYILYNPALPREIDVELHKSLDHTSVVCCVKFSNDGEYLATGCNKTTQVYRVSDGSLVARLSDSSDLYIRSVCFSPDGKFLATGAEDRLIRIWDIENRKIVMILQGHEQDIYSLDYFPSGDKLVSGSGDRTVRIWDLRTGQCSLTLSIEDGVTTVAVSPGDGKYIAAGSLDRAVRVWDSETGFLVERLDTGHKDSVYSVVFTRDGQSVVSGSLDRSVKLWNLTCEVTYIGHKDFVLSVATTQNDEYILSGSKDRGVLFWDKKSGNPLLMLQGHRNSVISVAVANGSSLGPEYNVFATGSGDCKARIWKYKKI